MKAILNPISLSKSKKSQTMLYGGLAAVAIAGIAAYVLTRPPVISPPTPNPTPTTYSLSLAINGSTGPVSLSGYPTGVTTTSGATATVGVAGAVPGTTVMVSIMTATSPLGIGPQTPSVVIIPANNGIGSATINFPSPGLFTVIALQGKSQSNSVTVNVINLKSVSAPVQGTNIISPPVQGTNIISPPVQGTNVISPPIHIVSPPAPVPAPVTHPKMIISPPRTALQAATMFGSNALPLGTPNQVMFGTTTYNMAPYGTPYGIDIIKDDRQPVLVASQKSAPNGRPYGMSNGDNGGCDEGESNCQ
jgi:hypothetical protein